MVDKPIPAVAFKKMGHETRDTYLERVTRYAQKILMQNRECFVAQYFRAHPNADPLDLVLITRHSSDGRMYFYIERKKKEKL